MKNIVALAVSILLCLPQLAGAQTPRSPADTLNLAEFGRIVTSDADHAVKEAEISRAVGIKFNLGQLSYTAALSLNGKVLRVEYADGKNELWQIFNIFGQMKVKALVTATSSQPGSYFTADTGATVNIDGYWEVTDYYQTTDYYGTVYLYSVYNFVVTGLSISSTTIGMKKIFM
jgi:hypothetical protein